MTLKQIKTGSTHLFLHNGGFCFQNALTVSTVHFAWLFRGCCWVGGGPLGLLWQQTKRRRVQLTSHKKRLTCRNLQLVYTGSSRAAQVTLKTMAQGRLQKLLMVASDVARWQAGIVILPQLSQSSKIPDEKKRFHDRHSEKTCQTDVILQDVGAAGVQHLMH